jgi:hypothetical protein
MPCECCQVFTEQNGCSIENRIKEYEHHIHLEKPEKSAVANTAPTWTTALSYRTPPSSPPRWHTWSRWLWRPLRLSSTQAIWRGKMACVAGGHGNPSSTLKRT